VRDYIFPAESNNEVQRTNIEEIKWSSCSLWIYELNCVAGCIIWRLLHVFQRNPSSSRISFPSHHLRRKQYCVFESPFVWIIAKSILSGNAALAVRYRITRQRVGSTPLFKSRTTMAVMLPLSLFPGLWEFLIATLFSGVWSIFTHMTPHTVLCLFKCDCNPQITFQYTAHQHSAESESVDTRLAETSPHIKRKSRNVSVFSVWGARGIVISLKQRCGREHCGFQVEVITALIWGILRRRWQTFNLERMQPFAC
jgi:hypothetical protein